MGSPVGAKDGQAGGFERRRDDGTGVGKKKKSLGPSGISTSLLTSHQLPPFGVTGTGPGVPVIFGEEGSGGSQKPKNVHFSAIPPPKAQTAPHTGPASCFPQFPVPDTPTWPPRLRSLPAARQYEA